jgi:YebC/PmpR family DNA-binding regulatory protein
MSGHSKWSTIKHKKAATDAKRGKLFTRLAREIEIAAQDGGDPTMNIRLRLAMDKGRAANMPKDNIERAIKRGTGELKGDVLDEILYEAYGPHGVAILVFVVTDNRNRSIADVRRIFTKMGGSMAEPGAVSWQFTRKGYLTVSANDHDGDQIFEIALMADAEDVVIGDEVIEVFSSVEDFQQVQEALEAENVKVESAELSYIPNTPLALPDKDALKVMDVIDALEDLDDVQQTYSNLDVTDELMEAYEAGQDS